MGRPTISPPLTFNHEVLPLEVPLMYLLNFKEPFEVPPQGFLQSHSNYYAVH